MAHLWYINDSTGDLEDLVYFCSDFCSDFCNSEWHPEGIAADGVEPYGGWYGLHEISCDEVCANCGEIVEGINEGGD